MPDVELAELTVDTARPFGFYDTRRLFGSLDTVNRENMLVEFIFFGKYFECSLLAGLIIELGEKQSKFCVKNPSQNLFLFILFVKIISHEFFQNGCLFVL